MKSTFYGLLTTALVALPTVVSMAQTVPEMIVIDTKPMLFPKTVVTEIIKKSMAVDVTSDNLTMDKKAQKAQFKGSVIIKRDALTLKAETVDVQLNADGKTMKEITATGGVEMQNGTNIGKGDTAIFLPETQKITLKGHVTLNRNGSSLSGDTLVYDLESGNMKLSAPESDGEETGRVRARFTLKNRENKE